MDNLVFIVTGAAGHLGSCVVQQLLREGRRVRALVLPGEACPGFIKENRHLLREYAGNVCDIQSLEPLFGQDETSDLIVVHCAGIVTITKKEDSRVYDVNVGGTSNVIEMCKRARVKRLTYVSSVHAIPPLPIGRVIREVASFRADAVHGYYDKTKAEATQLVLNAVDDSLDAVVVHPSGIIGPHGLPTGNMAQLISRFVHGKLTAAVNGGYDFVDVRDVADGIIAASMKGRRGECYILSNRFVEFREMFTILARLGAPKKLKVYLPLWVAKAVAPFAELYYRMTHITPLFTRYSLQTLSANGMYSHDKASRDLGYKVRPLKDTLADTIRWIKGNHR